MLALEAAFANGAPGPGDQMVFTRIRVTAGVPVDGTYTVTHPYGTETFPDVVAGVGNRDIIFTEDVGIVAGQFTSALHSRVGPFLQASTTAGGLPSAPVNLNGALFLSDGVTPESLTGSPFGTNYFEICGPFDGPPPILDRCIRENTFTLTGRLHNFVANPIGSPLAIRRATYARDAAGTKAQVDVLANASAGIGQPAPRLTAAAPNVSPVLMSGPTVLGDFYAQGIPVPVDTIPSVITVTNSGDVPPTSVTQRISDVVTIPQASYNPGTLTVIATSSDKLAPVPTLAIDGFPGATQGPGGIPGDPAAVTFTVTPVPIPPSAITVVSSNGGQGFAEVTMGLSPPFPCGVPFTQDDTAAATQGGPSVIIPVLANDSTNPVCQIVSLPAILAPGPNIGTATVLTDNTISYTPPGTTGTAIFKYTITNGVGASNVATVTVDVIPGAGGPVPTANPDAFTVFTGQSTVLNVLANDTGNGGTLDPATVAITTAPLSGTATANANGTITYTAGTTAGTFTFAYTVANTNGKVSPPATVTVTVTAPQTVTITPPAQYRAGGTPEWRVQGTTAPVVANTTITVTLIRNGAPVGTVGTATADALGAWRLNLKGAGLLAARQGDIVRATSSIPGSIPGQLVVTIK